MLIGAPKARGIIEHVIEYEDVPIRNRFLPTALTPAAERPMGVTTRDVTITRSASKNDLDAVASSADPIKGIERHENIKAAIDPDRCTVGIMDDVVKKFNVVCLVVDPRRLHELKPSSLAGGEPPGPALKERVVLDPYRR
jgi:hypothetical protein